MNETALCKSVSEVVALDYDAYVAGSDQIWNYHITSGHFDKVYFLAFDTTADRIVYAASSHDVPFEKAREAEFYEILKSTKAQISIRELSLAKYASGLTKTEYPVVLDPTLLVNKDVFQEIERSCIEDKKYILLYQIDRNPNSDVSIKNLEKHFKCKVYSLSVPRLDSFIGRMGHKGPGEFLSLINNASFIVTNSFHGVALSIVYEKQFYVYENGGVMSRIDDLLSILHIRNRKISNICDINLNNLIDYASVTQYLQKKKAESMHFLETALKGNDNGNK